LKVEAPVGLGDTVTVRVEVTEKLEKGRLSLACTCLNHHGKMVIEGMARVIAPREKVRRARVVLPEVHLHVQGVQYARMIAETEALKPVRTAVVHPCDNLSLTGALEAADRGMIIPVLVGTTTKA
jgi:phosphate acetyltransferase/phosphate butyryltransferase